MTSRIESWLTPGTNFRPLLDATRDNALRPVAPRGHRYARLARLRDLTPDKNAARPGCTPDRAA
jgi:hypothetical protein